MQEPTSPAQGPSPIIHPLLRVSLCASALAFALAGLPDVLYIVRGGQEPEMPLQPPWAVPAAVAQAPTECDFEVLDDGRIQPCGPVPSAPKPARGQR